MRLVVEADDYEEAVRFYRDVLGLPVELANPAQKRYIDQVEVGRPVAPRLRVAFEVADGPGVTQRLATGGASIIAPPTETPWRSLNSRLAAPGGLQITIFEESPDHGAAT
jgi:predicted enzyme related to lactoylglutathione lyase